MAVREWSSPIAGPRALLRENLAAAATSAKSSSSHFVITASMGALELKTGH